MIFDRKFDRAVEWLKERRGDAQRALDDEALGSKVEKGDTLAMILSALIVILPACLLVLAGASLIAYFFLVR